jgi:glutathione S-transferase
MSELVLHQPPNRSWGAPNLSPFCAKLETYLRMTDVPYKLGPFGRSNAPKGKVPFVMLDGKYMGDSQLIIDELERRRAASGKEPLDAGMSVQDAATARLVRRMLEEALYFVGMYQRWVHDEGYCATAGEFAKFVPRIALPFVRRMQRKKLYEQGTGRHTFDEVMAMGIADWDAIAGTLGDKPFLLGDKPRIVDAGMYGFLEGTLRFPVDTPLTVHVRGTANLVAYRDRIRAQWWKDLPAS